MCLIFPFIGCAQTECVCWTNVLVLPISPKHWDVHTCPLHPPSRTLQSIQPEPVSGYGGLKRMSILGFSLKG